MILRHLAPLFGSGNLDIDSNRVAWERSGVLFSTAFSLIEAGVILGLLRAGIESLPAGAQWEQSVLWLLWGAGYLLTGVYVLTGSNYVLAQLFGKLGWDGRNLLAQWVFRVLTFLASMAAPYFVDVLTSQTIVRALS